VICIHNYFIIIFSSAGQKVDNEVDVLKYCASSCPHMVWNPSDPLGIQTLVGVPMERVLFGQPLHNNYYLWGNW
jgi:hypothetical protein